ncbi:beta-amyrin 28-monooxygenase-like isoform X1 [Rhododendron vialii]|uniref:beta-amyrin 28-monooxygenase-like isoform X1 n=1 Tax=Rhododendron vialii TaxID=182163 RepID=UPI00265F28F6|nr:beta-amyrin 28-monooxygenase-like isoform X1 [Rhododendron vialii]
MESCFSLPLLLSITFFISISLHYLFRKLKTHGHLNIPSVKNSPRNAPLPPGSTGWPFIGETFQYLSMARKGLPEKFIGDRRDKYSTKVFKTSLLGEPMAILCTAEGNKFVFSNENKLVHSWWPQSVEKIFPHSKNGLTTKEESKKLREFLPAFLKPDSLRKYVGVMDQLAKKHLSRYWDDREEVKVHCLMRKYTFTLGCKLLLNIDDRELIDRLEGPFSKITAGFISLPINVPGTKFNRAIRASRELHKDIKGMIKKRRIELSEKEVPIGEDILSQMVVENGQVMDEWDMANKILGLLTGAHDTASIALVSIIKFLAELPEIYDGVLREQMQIANEKGPEELLTWGDIKRMRYSWNVVNEVLRLSPPLQGTFREAITDFTYEGFLIPKGWKIHWNAYSTHKNPEYFPDPERFDPSRHEGDGPLPYSFVPFGGGPRMCPGMEYARLEILTFLHNLVTKFRWEKVFPDEKIIIDPIPLPARGLPIRLHPHKIQNS